MALRPRSHQLEDESINAFKQCIPSQWVVREKSRDYGIDLEVEIFDKSSKSTGLTFLVQLKSTDDTSGRKIRLKTDYLHDICSYDSPSIIAKFFARDGKIFWAWAADFLIQIPEGQGSKTFDFLEEQVLQGESLDEVYAALEFSRYREAIPAEMLVLVHLSFENMSGKRRLEIQRSLKRVDASTRAAIKFVAANETKDLVGVEIRDDVVLIWLGPRYGTRIEIDETLNSDEVANRILYVLSLMLSRAGMEAHAEYHSLSLLELGIKTKSRILASEAVDSIIQNFVAYVDLALLNDLHHVQDQFYVGVVMGLLNRNGDRAEISRQSMRFLNSALNSAADVHSEAVIYYSMANAARKTDVSFAFSLYLKAKRKWPEYKQIGYFLRETAGCLFMLGRYRLAKKLYEASDLDKNNRQDCLLLGDACLFAKDFESAKTYLTFAAGSDVLALSADARLKLFLRDELSNENDPAFHLSALTDRFNSGVKFVEGGEYQKALVQFLVYCILVPADHESWINAVICCQQTSNMELYDTVLTVGFYLEGEALLDSLLVKLEESDASDQHYDFVRDIYTAVQNEPGYESLRSPFLFSKITQDFDVSIEENRSPQHS